MNNYLNKLYQRHRRLNRLIDNCKAASRQQELRQLKKIRLRIKDEIAAARMKLEPARL
ncbi:Protein of unknown function [Parasphingorhabdus marina DSM 22363]|uniref:DUF465 domain-containing protein n=1 Tax=Parasphingorhabdus marina DSM 22363 TaxID=1123272 RepID=A0A1N6GN06_9SPHN|nr:YdcH family protein [Parasphingorhabdus marina]SIO08910.1 Protein of unknown function [Parasphingorhabdus marina DSM 22363]